MEHKKTKICSRAKNRGAALVLTIIILVVLTTVVYRVSSSVSRWKRRAQYMIDYQTARYAAESGMKYALATITDLNPSYVQRPNEPDFSDLFTLSDQEYKELIAEWAEFLADSNEFELNTTATETIDFSLLFGLSDPNDPNSGNNMFGDLAADTNQAAQQQEPQITIRGPYGAQWPFVTEPVELDFGSAKVKIEIIDENAKLPILWAISSDKDVESETEAAVVSFCEWMQMEPNQIELFQDQMADIKDIKAFSTDLKPVVTMVKREKEIPTDVEASRSKRSSRRRRSSRSRRNRNTTVKKARPQIGHTRDFAKLMHSPMIDVEALATVVNDDPDRPESALKYLGTWGSSKVNINTAPRHVLEAAFTFGGDSVEIADTIIKERISEPFESIENLTDRLMSYKGQIDECTNYITTQSDYFSIRVTAVSGVAKVGAIAGMKKEKSSFEKIGLIIE